MHPLLWYSTGGRSYGWSHERASRGVLPNHRHAGRGRHGEVCHAELGREIAIKFLPKRVLVFDVSQHGRSLMPTEVEQPANTSMTRVVKWTTALKK